MSVFGSASRSKNRTRTVVTWLLGISILSNITMFRLRKVARYLEVVVSRLVNIRTEIKVYYRTDVAVVVADSVS